MRTILLTIGVCVVFGMTVVSHRWIGEFVQGCARIFPYGWATEYKMTWSVCRQSSTEKNPECSRFSYTVPESSTDPRKATIDNYTPSTDENGCIDTFHDRERVRWCGGLITFKLVSKEVAKSGYRSEWFPITCATTPEQDFPEPDMDAVWVEIRSRCEDVKKETGKKCDCENMPLDCQ